MNSAILRVVEHDLGDGCRFLAGQLPSELMWQDDQFEANWQLHPQAKHVIRIHGKEATTPRWQQSYGEDYHYTGTTNQALPMPEALRPLLTWVQEAIDARLNGLLLNWYEGPGHYIGPHHDSTHNLVRGVPIITLSFGETRTFRLSKGRGAGAQVRDFSATPGALFILPYATNLIWKHAVPKSARYTGRRISVTVRAFHKQDIPSEH